MKRGFPRPLTKIGTTSSNPKSGAPLSGSYGKRWDNRVYPHPYAADEDNLARIHEGRKAECVIFKLCLNCGKPVEEEVVGLLFANPNSPLGKPHEDYVHTETGPYHFKCLVQSLTLCPALSTSKRFVGGNGEWKVVRPIILDRLTRF